MLEVSIGHCVDPHWPQQQKLTTYQPSHCGFLDAQFLEKIHEIFTEPLRLAESRRGKFWSHGEMGMVDAMWLENVRSRFFASALMLNIDDDIIITTYHHLSL